MILFEVFRDYVVDPLSSMGSGSRLLVPTDGAGFVVQRTSVEDNGMGLRHRMGGLAHMCAVALELHTASEVGPGFLAPGESSLGGASPGGS